MKARALALAGLLVLLNGCDVIVAGIILGKKKESSDDGPAVVVPPPPPPPGTYFECWVKDGLTGSEDAELTALLTSDPDDLGWSSRRLATTSTEFDASPGSFSHVLIQSFSTVPYFFDAIEFMNANDVVIDSPAVPRVFGNAFISPEDGFALQPDGITANSTATLTTDTAYIIVQTTAGWHHARVSAWSDPLDKLPGDVEFAAVETLALTQTPGGACIDASGRIYMTATTGADVHIFGVDGDGTSFSDDATVTSAVTGVGRHSIVYDAATTNFFVGTTAGAGDILVRKFNATFGAPGGGWMDRTFDSTETESAAISDRVESHCITIDSTGHVFIAGGFVQKTGPLMPLVGSPAIQPWANRLDGTTGAPLAGWPVLSDDVMVTADNWWRGVTTNGTDLFLTGNSNSEQFVTSRLLNTGATATGWPGLSTSGGAPRFGNAVSFMAGGSGTVRVGGASTGTGLDRHFLTYSGTGVAGTPSILTGAGDEAILDLVIDTDGTYFAVGYETITSPAQGENMWIRKYDESNNVVWTRTFNGTSNGNDRAVSVLIDGIFVIVVGYENPGTQDLHVRKYVK